MFRCCATVCFPGALKNHRTGDNSSTSFAIDRTNGNIYESVSPVDVWDETNSTVTKEQETRLQMSTTRQTRGPPADSTLASISTQTDTVLDEEFQIQDESFGTLNRFGMEVESYIDASDLDDQCRRDLDAVEFEEVTLHRCSSADRIGLTLCYGGSVTEDAETDIFISEIEAASIADHDGRIREGDQILQINGVDVHTRDQAIRLFKRNKKEISLLVARTTAGGPSTEDDEQLKAFDDDALLGASCLGLGAGGLTPTMAGGETALEQIDEEKEPRGDSATDGSAKDSGISRATDSDPELLPPPQIEDDDDDYSNTTTPTGAAALLSSTTLTMSTAVGTAGVGCRQTAAGDVSGGESAGGSLERELRSLHREMETIRLECDRLITKHASAEKKVLQQVAKAQSLMVAMDSMAAAGGSTEVGVAGHPANSSTQHGPPPPVPLHRRNQTTGDESSGTPRELATVVMRRPEDTSSAYNTGGDSCRSTPMKAIAHTTLDLRRPIVVPQMTPPPVIKQQLTQPHQQPSPSYQSPRTSITQSPHKLGADESQGQAHFQAGDVMYTCPENLQKTILLQQRMLRQAMIHQAQQLKNQQTMVPDGGPVQSASMYQALQDQVEASQWKVKRRSDGSRYITKRPIRNRLLEKRAAELCKERVGISTDDDATSELKVGRWWSKDERKKHIEATRVRKLRQQELLRRKNAALVAHGDDPIVRLSQHKMRRRHALFDNFTTLQEHLARRHSQPTPQLGILSVTTV